MWVLNALSGVYHLLADDDAVAVCGWPYTKAPHALVPAGEPGPSFFWQVCGSCDPAKRRALKAAATAVVRGRG